MTSPCPRAMILAAGLGTRLRPLTNLLPKPMVPVANRPLISHNLALLRLAGVREVAINLHYLGNCIHQELKAGLEYGLQLTYSLEDPILGTGGGIVRLRQFLDEDQFFLINGDILAGVDLNAVLNLHREKQAHATMVVRPFPAGSSYTPLGMDEAGWICDFKDIHLPAQGSSRPVMFSGVHVLTPAIFDFLPREGFSSISDDGYMAMMRAGIRIAAFLDHSPWFELGTPADYLNANLDILSGRVRFPQLDLKSRLNEHGVLLGDRLKVAPSAKLGPLVAVGDDCVIAEGTRIERSVVWNGSLVPADSVFSRAIVAGNITLQL